MKKRIGNDITFTWHIYRKSGETQTPESFDGKDVEVKLISPLQRPVTIEDVTIATGVVTFTFKGKYQTTLGNYVAVLLENKGEDGMVTLDVVNAVTLVPHSYMEEDGDEGDVIEATSVELDSEIGQGIDAYTKAETDNLFLRKRVAQGGQYAERGLVTSMVYTIDGVGVLSTNAYAGGIIIGHNTNTLTLSPDAIIKSAGYTSPVSVVWADTATSQIPAATTSANGLMSAADKGKLDALPTNEQLTEELGGKQDTINDLTTIRSGAQAGATAYQKPITGIPATDLASAVQVSLGKADTALQEHQSLAGLVNTGNYNTVSKKIELKHDNTILAEIDATAFIKDGMVDSVVVSNGYIVITFNTDAGKETIRIPVTDIFDPNNYYDKDDVDGLLAGKVDKITGKGLSTNDYTTEEKTKLGALPTNEGLTQALGGKANTSDLANVATSGSYNDLSDKPTIPTVPTNVSAFTNDAGYLTQHQDITGKADKVSNATNGNFAALDSNGNLIDSGHKHSDYLTQHQDLTNYVQKSQTAGLLKNDGTVDTNTYLTQHQDISGKADKSEMSVVPGTGADADKTTITLKQGTSATVLTAHQDITGKEDVTNIVTPVDATDATLPITTLTCEVGKCYRIDVAVDTLAITLPAMTDLTTARTVVLYFTAGTTPAITISTADSKDVYYQDGFEIEAGETYEINALFNGAAWIVASVKINVE